MNDPDYEYNETPCPKCGHSSTHTRSCTECDDGAIDLYEEDAILHQPGEFKLCVECRGTGSLHWCPGCGHDLRWCPACKHGPPMTRPP